MWTDLKFKILMKVIAIFIFEDFYPGIPPDSMWFASVTSSNNIIILIIETKLPHKE